MESNQVVQALASLAQVTRLDLYRLLVQQGPQGLAAGQIAKQLGIPATTLSFHLNHVQQSGLITAKRAGRSIIYSANYQVMQQLIDYLSHNCCEAQPASSDCCNPDRSPT